MDIWLGKAVTVQCSEPTEEQLGICHRVSHVDSGISSDKPAHFHKDNDYGIEGLLSEIQKGSQHGNTCFGTFSGDSIPSKGRVSYAIIQSPEHQRSLSQMCPKGRKVQSLKGEAADLVHCLGVVAVYEYANGHICP